MSRAGTAASSSEFGYNDGESVNVVLRVRPLLAHETTRGDRCSVFVDSKGTGVTLDMGEAGEGSSQQHFAFNQCFDSRCSQDSLFEESGIKEVGFIAWLMWCVVVWCGVVVSSAGMT